MNAKEVKARERKARVDGYVRNIIKTYRTATPTEWSNGIVWYAEAYRVITQIAETFGVCPKIASAVCASLSPNNSWSGNLVDLQKVLAAWKSGELANCASEYDAAPGSFKARGNAYAFKRIACQTYPMNVLKAYRILVSGDVSHLASLKVTAFFNNIYHEASQYVTVDCHAYSVVHNKHYTTKECPNITPRIYAELSEAYAIAAERYGLNGYQMQAVTWIAWRRLIGIHASKG